MAVRSSADPADCGERPHAEAAGIHGIGLMLDNVVGWAMENAFADPGLNKLWGKTWSGEALMLCGHRSRHATLSEKAASPARQMRATSCAQLSEQCRLNGFVRGTFCYCCAALSTLIE
jgi:hypothetical protein